MSFYPYLLYIDFFDFFYWFCLFSIWFLNWNFFASKLDSTWLYSLDRIKSKKKSRVRNTSSFYYSYSNATARYEIALIASTRVLARRRARFASIVCLFPSAFLKLTSAISRVSRASCGSIYAEYPEKWIPIFDCYFVSAIGLKKYLKISNLDICTLSK